MELLSPGNFGPSELEVDFPDEFKFCWMKAENPDESEQQLEVQSREEEEGAEERNRFVVFTAAGGVFSLVVRPGESGEVFVVDGEVLRLLTGWLGYHAD